MDDAEVFDRIVLASLALIFIVVIGQATPPIRSMLALLGGS